MLSCKDITEKANEYMDRELPFWSRLSVKFHLLMCVHCRRYVNQLKVTVQALGLLKQSDDVNENTVELIVQNLKKHQHTP